MVGRVDGEKEEGGEVKRIHGSEGPDRCFIQRRYNFHHFGIARWNRGPCIASKGFPTHDMYDMKHAGHRNA